MRFLLAIFLALLLTQPALAESPTGNSGRALAAYSGYHSHNAGPFTSVHATFRVPSFTYDTDGPVSGEGGFIWDGITDQVTLALIQTGIRFRFTDTSGTPELIAWYECLPANLVQFGNTVQIGDVINVNIDCTDCTQSAQVWTAVLQDVTQGWTATQTNISCGLGSNQKAYFVAETQLPNQKNIVHFGDINWTSITINGANPGFAQALQTGGVGNDGIYTYANGGGTSTATANVSVPNATTDGFKDCWGTGDTSQTGNTGYTACPATPSSLNTPGRAGF